MRLVTPDKTELIVVTVVEPHKDGIAIEGTIMGAMPMKAVLTPAELRRSLRFVSFRLVFKLLAMLFARRSV